MHALYGTDITVEELREEVDVDSREALTEEFVEDALDTYGEREEAFGSELMREIERFVILQIVDTRWREHLESMDYLREGVHLRAMAQKDPLVEYRGEGHVMFEELGRIIREEVVLTLFHVEIQLDDAEQQLQPAQTPQAARVRAREHAGGRRDRSRGRRRRDRPRRPARDHRDGLAEAGRQRASRHRSERSVLVRVGQEVQALPRLLRLGEPRVLPRASSFCVGHG